MFRNSVAVGATPCYRCGLPTAHMDALDQPLCSLCDDQLNHSDLPRARGALSVSWAGPYLRAAPASPPQQDPGDNGHALQ
eukprot:6530305-Heterocapsa_arctica.AAC.1